ncbi:MAG: PTS transporter subunit IIC [Desulfurococcaceae archaeon]
MDPLTELLNFVVAVFRTPALFLGTIALIGLLALRERVEKIISGTLRTALGLVILLAGVSVMVSALQPLGTIAAEALKLPPVKVEIGTNKVILDLGFEIGLVMVFAFLINVIVARISKTFRYIFLTGHLIFWNAVIYTAAFRYILGLTGWSLILAATIFTAFYQIIQPWYTHFFDVEVNEKAGFVLGHSSSLVVLLTSLITKPLARGGRKFRSMEELTFPAALSWLREPMLMLTASYFIIYLIVGILSWDRVVSFAAQAGNHPVVWIILQAFNFGAGFAVLIMGVRMIIADLIPAFQGIAQRIVPGAVPALDCPLFFPYGQVSMAYGGIIGMLTMVFMSILFSTVLKYPWYIFAPTMSVWFHGATAAIYGNKYAGVPGAIIGGVLAGVLMAIGQAIMWPIMGFAIGDFYSWASDTDYVWFPLIIYLFSLLKSG